MNAPDILNRDMLRVALGKNQSAWFLQQRALTSGKKYTLRSEATVDAARAATLRQEAVQEERWAKNIKPALLWSQISEPKINLVSERMQQMRELIIQAKDATYNASLGRTHFASQVDAALEDLVAVANFRNGDAYLCGGIASENPPVTVVRDGNGRITDVSFSVNEMTQRQVQLDVNTTVSFGVVAAGNGNGLFANNLGTPQEENTLELLIQLRDTLYGTSMPTDADLADVETALGNAINLSVELGIQQNRFQDRQNRLLLDSALRDNYQGMVENTDVAATAMELKKTETAMTATLQMISMYERIRLVDFL